MDSRRVLDDSRSSLVTGLTVTPLLTDAIEAEAPFVHAVLVAIAPREWWSHVRAAQPHDPLVNYLVFGSSGPGNPVGWVVLALALMVIAGWLILANSRLVQGGVVEHPHRVPQLYGYTACLIGLLWGLTSLKSVVESSLTLADPLYNSSAPWTNWSEPSVTSFEAFRTTYERMREMRPPEQARPEPLPDAELQRRYEALRADRIARNQVAAKRSLVLNILMLIIAGAVFVLHWRWLRGRPQTAT